MPVGFFSFFGGGRDRVAGAGERRDGKAIAKRRAANKRARRARRGTR